MSVNGGQLPSNSELPPRLHRKKKICTFADVEECPHYSTPSPKGSGQCSTTYYLIVMAKSKSGGTRAYLRGKIGADVYSIGRDGKGAKQQVVRSLAEVVSNPQTENQMRGRMIMATVMQAESALSPIINHSFDNVPAGQPSISEFISRNYALVKADVAAHPASGNSFGLNKWQEKGAKDGAYILSSGKVEDAGRLMYTSGADNLSFTLDFGGQAATYGNLKARIGLGNGDYVTMLGFEAGTGKLFYGRFYFKDNIADDTAVTAESIATMFDVDTNCGMAVSFAEGAVKFEGEEGVSTYASILSVKTAAGWEHSTARMKVKGTPTFTANVALPTYPVGSQRFLNGGEI